MPTTINVVSLITDRDTHSIDVLKLRLFNILSPKYMFCWPEREIYKSVAGPDDPGFGSRRARNIAMDSMSSKRFAEKLSKETKLIRKHMQTTTLDTLPELRTTQSAPAKQQVGAACLH